MAFIEQELIFKLKDHNTLRKSKKFFCWECNKDFKGFYIGGPDKWNAKRCIPCYLNHYPKAKKETYELVDELISHIEEQMKKAEINAVQNN